MNRLSYLLLILPLFIYAQDKKLSLDDIYTNAEFYSQDLKSVQWFEDGNKFSYLDYDTSSNTYSLFQYDVNSRSSELLLPLTKIREEIENNSFVIKNYTWSPKENYLLFTETIPARSLKTGGDFYVYDVNKEEVILEVPEKGEVANIKFSPDESKIGFVRDNNLFVIDIADGKETKLTFDGSETILNGVFDWAYEEEFSIIEAWEWSPDSKKIAFWRTDQSAVPVFPIVLYDSLYTSLNNQRYPKVGSPVSEIQIGVVDVSSAEIKWMDIGDEKNIYIPRMMFTNNPEIVSIQRLNRMQNKLELLFADVNTGESKVILTEEDEHWVDVWDHLTFMKNSERFIWSSERDGYLHLYLYDYDGNLLNQITRGNFEVDNLLSVDEQNEKIYYTSNERSILNKDLYSISLTGNNKKRITKKAGSHSIDMSYNNKFFIDKYSSANLMSSLELKDINNEIITQFYEPDMSFVEEFNFSPVELFTFTTSDNVELNAFLVKPHNYDSTKKYPVIIYNYSGPGSQTVKDSWMSHQYYFFNYLAQEGFFVLAVDNRGTNGRGKEFEHIVYKNLGKWELNDIVEGIKYLDKQGLIDPARVGIYGSSYGGFIAGLALLKEPDHFKVGIDVAGLSHWKYYDAIYTERFMLDETLNPEGYTETDMTLMVNNLKGNLLLVHGTADDNVHMQNTIELVEALTKANKKFDLMLYPGKKHGGYGRHYLQLLTDYFKEKL